MKRLTLITTVEISVPSTRTNKCLSQIQVCLLEFGTGRYEPKELNTAAQYNMYISHIRGLELYQQRAPRRLARMQQDWFDYVM
jgi:hypothetical protein